MKLVITKSSPTEPLIEVYPDMIVANRTHGDFELCQALLQLQHTSLDFISDSWDPKGSVLRIWAEEVRMNKAYGIDDISRAVSAAQQAEKELAEQFLVEQDKENPYTEAGCYSLA